MSHESTSDLLKYLDSQAGRPTTSDGPKLTPKDLLPYIGPYSSPITLNAQLTQLNADVKATGKGTNSKIDPTNPIPPKDVNSKLHPKLSDDKCIANTHEDGRDL